MNTPTQAGMIEAARRSNEVTVAKGFPGHWQPKDFESSNSAGVYAAFAIACDELLAKDAELAAAKVALGEVHRVAQEYGWRADQYGGMYCPKREIIKLAAPYAVVTDPLVAVFDAMSSFLVTGADETTSRFRAELAKRGITIPEAGQ